MHDNIKLNISYIKTVLVLNKTSAIVDSELSMKLKIIIDYNNIEIT